MFSFKIQTLESRSNGAVEENTARSSSFLSENDKTSAVAIFVTRGAAFVCKSCEKTGMNLPTHSGKGSGRKILSKIIHSCE